MLLFFSIIIIIFLRLPPSYWSLCPVVSSLSPFEWHISLIKCCLWNCIVYIFLGGLAFIAQCNFLEFLKTYFYHYWWCICICVYVYTHKYRWLGRQEALAPPGAVWHGFWKWDPGSLKEKCSHLLSHLSSFTSWRSIYVAVCITAFSPCVPHVNSMWCSFASVGRYWPRTSPAYLDWRMFKSYTNGVVLAYKVYNSSHIF